MASVNGCQHLECEDPAHDSKSNLHGPHGSERQENTSAAGAGGGGTVAWSSKGYTIYQTPLISIPPGTQDGESQSRVPRTHRTHYKSVPEIRSLKYIVSSLFHIIVPAISHHHLGHCSEVEVIHKGDNNKCIVQAFCSVNNKFLDRHYPIYVPFKFLI
jgi:hypothetical protein